MSIELTEPEATLLMVLMNQHIVSLQKPSTPMETDLIVKIVEARKEAAMKSMRPKI
jgi:hypothetical protein